MWGKKPGRDRAQRQFFYRELTKIWDNDGLEQQAFTLVKHANMSLSDINNLTLVERNIYVDLLTREFEKEKEEIESIRSRRGR